VDVRVIAATNRDLAAMVERGSFRRDLYHRLKVIEIALPPLRERKGDLGLIVDDFFDRFRSELDKNGCAARRLHPTALTALSRRSFRGNARELINLRRRASLFARGPEIMCGDLGLSAERAVAHDETANERRELGFKEAKARVVDGFEHRYLET